MKNSTPTSPSLLYSNLNQHFPDSVFQSTITLSHSSTTTTTVIPSSSSLHSNPVPSPFLYSLPAPWLPSRFPFFYCFYTLQLKWHFFHCLKFHYYDRPSSTSVNLPMASTWLPLFLLMLVHWMIDCSISHGLAYLLSSIFNTFSFFPSSSTTTPFFLSSDFFLDTFSPTLAKPWLIWLTGTPFHLKLNLPLSHFLSEFFNLALVGYDTLLKFMLPPLFHLLQLMFPPNPPWSFLFLTSFVFAFMYDVLKVSLFLFYYFYQSMFKIISAQRHWMVHLGASFLGQKYNPLRHRTESAIASLDQVLISTFLFTIVLFLSPTTLLFFSFFKLLDFGRRMILTLLSHAIHAIHYLPLYILLWDLLHFIVHPKCKNPPPTPTSHTDMQIDDTINPPLVYYRPLTLNERLWGVSR